MKCKHGINNEKKPCHDCINESRMSPDNKVKDYLERAGKLVGSFDSSDFTQQDLDNYEAKIVEVAKMIQKEEHEVTHKSSSTK